jgi:solute carrier family 38 (sodium-coupled neutral amino acid transporter), member 2
LTCTGGTGVSLFSWLRPLLFLPHWHYIRYLIQYYASENLFLLFFLLADSLSYTSAISIALAVVFVTITAGIAIVKLIAGQILMPKLFPAVPDLASVWELITAVPVLVTAYVCHYNGTNKF